MTNKTFTTKDANGCEFRVDAYYGNKEWNAFLGKWDQEKDFYGMGFHTHSLPELKRLVAQK